jgi:HPt (histidine-containing phosphotransfer) domain-containing protein
MNIQALAENLELAVEEIIQLMKLFHESSMGDLKILQSAWAHGAAPEVAEAAHSIKGGAINLGLQGIHKVAKEIEVHARQRNLKGAEKSILLLKKKLDRLAESIQSHSLNPLRSL